MIRMNFVIEYEKNKTRESAFDKFLKMSPELKKVTFIEHDNEKFITFVEDFFKGLNSFKSEFDVVNGSLKGECAEAFIFLYEDGINNGL